MTSLPRTSDTNNAEFKGTYKGRRIFAFDVKVTVSKLSGTVTVARQRIVAPNAADALAAIKAEMVHRVFNPFEVETSGPKGGSYFRFAGWDTIIGERMFARADARQTSFTALLSAVR